MHEAQGDDKPICKTLVFTLPDGVSCNNLNFNLDDEGRKPADELEVVLKIVPAVELLNQETKRETKTKKKNEALKRKSDGDETMVGTEEADAEIEYVTITKQYYYSLNNSLLIELCIDNSGKNTRYTGKKKKSYLELLAKCSLDDKSDDDANKSDGDY
jgi:hypothetical protein